MSELDKAKKDAEPYFFHQNRLLNGADRARLRDIRRVIEKYEPIHASMIGRFVLSVTP